MHLSECFAVGGFKINGPSTKDKGPMDNEEDLKSSNETSLPQPTQAGRIETCTELISKAMKCLENNDKRCVTRLIEELVQNQCHNGNAVGKEVAGEVKRVFHNLWLAHEKCRCELLNTVKSLNVARNWIQEALNTNTKTINKWLRRCGIEWAPNKTMAKIIEEIERLMKRLGWNRVEMCKRLFEFIGIDVKKYEKYGIKLCDWLKDLKELRDLKNAYWFGMRCSDMHVRKHGKAIELKLETSNSIDAIFFPVLLSAVKTPHLTIRLRRRKVRGMRYVTEWISLGYYIEISDDEWIWPIKLNPDEIRKILSDFDDEKIERFLAAILDGDGTITYEYDDDESDYVRVEIAMSKGIIDVLNEIITRRFNVVGHVYKGAADVLSFHNENAVKLLRRVVRYMHHPLRRLRAELLILMYYDKKINRAQLLELYTPTTYRRGAPDIKRNSGLDVLVRAAPQTHTHGG